MISDSISRNDFFVTYEVEDFSRSVSFGPTRYSAALKELRETPLYQFQEQLSGSIKSLKLYYGKTEVADYLDPLIGIHVCRGDLLARKVDALVSEILSLSRENAERTLNGVKQSLSKKYSLPSLALIVRNLNVFLGLERRAIVVSDHFSEDNISIDCASGHSGNVLLCNVPYREFVQDVSVIGLYLESVKVSVDGVKILSFHKSLDSNEGLYDKEALTRVISVVRAFLDLHILFDSEGVIIHTSSGLKLRTLAKLTEYFFEILGLKDTNILIELEDLFERFSQFHVCKE